jgi:SAM-dependent methyltransferase
MADILSYQCSNLSPCWYHVGLMDVREHNKKAWDRMAGEGCEWTIPVTPEVIARARKGEWTLSLIMKPVPGEWLGDIKGVRVLCLAASGGQQAPILAAAGAVVTVLDNSPAQLARDREVAERDNLAIETVEGDMADLSRFASASFGLVVNAISTHCVPDVRNVWRECFRVLKPGGVFIMGFTNPHLFMFDDELGPDYHTLKAVHKLPYSDVTDSSEERKRLLEEKLIPVEFSHTMEEMVGGQMEAGFLLTRFVESSDTRPEREPVADYMPLFFMTRAVKPA